jgi:hypothetical protein
VGYYLCQRESAVVEMEVWLRASDQDGRVGFGDMAARRGDPRDRKSRYLIGSLGRVWIADMVNLVHLFFLSESKFGSPSNRLVQDWAGFRGVGCLDLTDIGSF